MPIASQDAIGGSSAIVPGPGGDLRVSLGQHSQNIPSRRAYWRANTGVGWADELVFLSSVMVQTHKCCTSRGIPGSLWARNECLTPPTIRSTVWINSDEFESALILNSNPGPAPGMDEMARSYRSAGTSTRMRSACDVSALRARTVPAHAGRGSSPDRIQLVVNRRPAALVVSPS